MKRWSKGKTKQQIENETFRTVETMGESDITKMLIRDYMTPKQQKEWVDSWHDNDEPDED